MRTVKDTAIYAGTFDPITKGHEWVIARGRRLYNLRIAIATNPGKEPIFSGIMRKRLIVKTTGIPEHLVQILPSNLLLVDYAKSIDASILLRGIRPGPDFDYEWTMRQINADIAPDIETVFLMPPRNLAEISSSLVKSFTHFKNWEERVAPYVSPVVLDALKEI